MGSTLCEHCAAACCRYVAIPLDKPTSQRDYDDMRWYLMHEGITVFVEEGDWYIQFQTRCKNIGRDNRCAAYETRPQICREYDAGECDYSPTAYSYDHLFTHPKQIEEYYKQRTGKILRTLQKNPQRKRTKRKSKKTA